MNIWKICLIGLLSGCVPSNEGETEISFSKIGYAQRDSIIVFAFTINNVGSNILKIDYIAVNDGASVDIDLRSIRPKEKVTIHGQLNINQFAKKDTIGTRVIMRSNSKNLVDARYIIFVLKNDSVYKLLGN